MGMELNMGMKVVLQWILKKEVGSAHDQIKNTYINTVTNLQVLQYQKTFRDLMNNKILRN
jgi:hypothetical protein